MSNLIVVSVDPSHADHKKPITLTDDERYKYCGFRNLNELKDYATHMGKTYSGTSFDECYSMLFGKNATEVANINKERHSKFVKPISVKDRLDKKRERLDRLEQLNKDNIPILAKLEQLQIRLERENIFNKVNEILTLKDTIGELNRKLVALEAFKLNFENSGSRSNPKSDEYNFLLTIIPSPMNIKNYVRYNYELPITKGNEFTYSLVIFDPNDSINGNIVCRIMNIDKQSDKLVITIHFARTDSNALRYQFKCYLTVKEVAFLEIQNSIRATSAVNGEETLYSFPKT